MVARKSFTRGAGKDLPPMLRLLRKQQRGLRSRESGNRPFVTLQREYHENLFFQTDILSIYRTICSNVKPLTQ